MTEPEARAHGDGMSAPGTVTEVVDFGGLRIAFDSRLLRPRDWTRAQSTWAADLLAHVPAGDVLELCSGVGHIGLLALHEATRAGSWDRARRLVCVDLDPSATQYVASNAEDAGVADQVQMRTGPMLEVLAPHDRFVCIIADPPWVPSDQTAQFPGDPVVAIDGGADGLRVTRQCLLAIERHLATGGVALLQLGPGDEQADAVTGLLAVTGLMAGERRGFERGTLLRIDRPS